MVTCHDLGTDKTLLYSGFGAVAINIKCTASDVLTIIYHLTNLLLLALGGGGRARHDTTKPNNSSGLNPTQNKRKYGFRTSMKPVSASDTTQRIPS